MHRKRHHKQPIVEKFVRNPLSDFKPGVFIPTFRLYGLDKASDETTVTCYNETEYVERKPTNKREYKMGCEVRLSECSIKAVNIRHQGQRRLNQRLEDIMKQRHAAIKETEIERQRIEHENTMKVKRVTIPLKDLAIPRWRYSDNDCRCIVANGTYCPVHWKTIDNTIIKPTTKSSAIATKRSFVVETVSDDDDDFNFYTGSKTSSQHTSFNNNKKHIIRPKTSHTYGSFNKQSTSYMSRAPKTKAALASSRIVSLNN